MCILDVRTIRPIIPPSWLLFSPIYLLLVLLSFFPLSLSVLLFSLHLVSSLFVLALPLCSPSPSLSPCRVGYSVKKKLQGMDVYKVGMCVFFQCSWELYLLSMLSNFMLIGLHNTAFIRFNYNSTLPVVIRVCYSNSLSVRRNEACF